MHPSLIGVARARWRKAVDFGFMSWLELGGYALTTIPKNCDQYCAAAIVC